MEKDKRKKMPGRLESLSMIPRKIVWPEEMSYMMGITKNREDVRIHALESAREIQKEIREKFPTRNDYDLIKKLVGLQNYANAKQASDGSEHNTIHLCNTGIFAGILATEYSAKQDNDDRKVNIPAAIIAGIIHDIRRKNNLLSTMFTIEGHGKAAAKMAPQFVEELPDEINSLAKDEKTVKLIQDCVYFHDNFNKAPEELTKDPTFQSLLLADSLDMVRFLMFNHKPFIASRKVTNYVVSRRLFTYPFIQELRERYIPIAAEQRIRSEEIADILRDEWKLQLVGFPKNSTEHKELQKKLENKDYQFEGSLRAAEEMGLLGKTDQLTNSTISFNV